MEAGGSVSISDDFMPVSASIKIVTFSNIPNAPESKEAVMTAIQGLGIGVGVTVDHVNMSVGVSPSGDIKNMKDTVHYDVGVSTTHYGIEATGAYTDYVGNINDAEIWDSDYNRIIYQYWYNHPEEPLEVYNGPSGHAMLIKRTPFGVLQHKGTTHGDNRDWYINRDFDRYNGRLYYRRVRM